MGSKDSNTDFDVTLMSSEYSVLMQAISNCAGQVVNQILSQHPELANARGWHGNTALHRACLVGDVTVVSLLIKAGADATTLNDSGETSVHYAAKRGIPSILQILTKYGGDVTTIDNQGKRLTHHAAETGCVYMLHYLSTVHNVSFRDVDKKLQSPLHIVCAFGHMEAFKYLIRKERSDLMQADSAGNTPMHVIVQEGHSHMAWMLLTELGCSALHHRNKEGFTPVDIACQRDRPGHKEITPILKYYEGVRDHNYKPDGPWLLWYWQLLSPALIYAVCVLLSKLLSQYQGVVFLAGMVVIVYMLKSQSHRIQHVCRWPNPIYSGVFGAGCFHTLVLYCYLIMPHLTHHVWLMIFSPLLAAVFLGLYAIVLFRDPGTIKESIINPATGKAKTLYDICTDVPPGKQSEYCIDCEIACSPWTKHCKLCKTCYEMMDHHCLFLLKCIAENNHRYFVWFIMACIASLATFVASVVCYCNQLYNLSLWLTLVTLFHTNGWLFSLCSLNCISILWGLQLLYFQLSNISKGYTTYFQPSENLDILTPSEKFMNVLYFFSNRKVYADNLMVKEKHHCHVV